MLNVAPESFGQSVVKILEKSTLFVHKAESKIERVNNWQMAAAIKARDANASLSGTQFVVNSPQYVNPKPRHPKMGLNIVMACAAFCLALISCWALNDTQSVNPLPALYRPQIPYINDPFRLTTEKKWHDVVDAMDKITATPPKTIAIVAHWTARFLALSTIVFIVAMMNRQVSYRKNIGGCDYSL